ncbi:DUF732 domain-containing protein [Nocardia cyriacigeorgica]|uniref:DUF732 domain-containing protein n=1 Tax=Nocardia cyriacigeorgica TaxID=135487 RepID=UPI0018963712|nr:DUF732 domain-containing protein [Nocardia cyriacigeorgica]MBF6085240.1 DUF732 domain-containing protein [Nocardia cyriacigeorgica]
MTVTTAVTTPIAHPAPTAGKRIYNARDNVLVALEFMNYLHQRDAPVPRGDSELAYHRGVEICTSFDSGESVQEIQEGWTPMLTSEGAMIYIRGAVEHICPEHAGLLDTQ